MTIQEFLGQTKDFLVEKYGQDDYDVTSELYIRIHDYRVRNNLPVVPIEARDKEWWISGELNCFSL
jgi:hypothetical protein